MQTVTELKPGESVVQVEAKSIVINDIDSRRKSVFWPVQNMVVIHEHETQRKIDLGYSSSRILEILIDRADSIVSRDDIFAFAWPDRIVGQNSLNQAISTIREILADEEHRAVIQTIPRRGYQFNSRFLACSALTSPHVADSELASEPQVVVATVESHLNLPPVIIQGLRTKALLVVIAFLVLALVGRIEWGLWAQPNFVKEKEVEGLLTSWYTGVDAAAIKNLRASTASVRQRMLHLLVAPGTAVFNTMHSFYEIACINGSRVEFVTVHKSKLQTLTDEQLGRCLK